MSRSGQGFIGLLPTQPKRPRASFFGPAGASSMLRDQFEIKTWLALGAIFQGLAFVLFGLWSLLPALAYLLYSLADTYLIILGWKSNPYMKDNIQKKFSAQIPDELGNYGNQPANSDIVVFLIGTRSNHPLGILAPGFKQSGDFMQSIVSALETHAEEFGFLGMTSWLNGSDRTTKSELMQVCYFRSIEELHAFAHSNHHREAWNWWNKTIKEHSHLSIWHETYHVPAKHWENIYINSHPGGVTSTTYKITDKETGEPRWASPVIDASKGLLKTSAGRMSRSKGEEHEKYGVDPY